MQPQRTTTRRPGAPRPPLVALPSLSTPDEAKYPLTSRYLPDGTELRPAAVYLRESEREQGKWSFETQYEKARDVLLRHGFHVAMVRQDSKSGSKISRAGYQDIEAAVQHGLVEAVGVYMMQRWGRRARERLRIGEEFDKLKVDVYDAYRGKADTPGMERIIFAGIDEQFLRDLSKKAIDNMPKAARAGKHAAHTPIGYKRVYPQSQPYDRHLTSVMVEDPVYGPLVREIFRRFANGESTKRIARWLNTLPETPNPRSKTGRWHAEGVARMLRRRVYKQYEDTEYGEIEWGKTHRGDWGYYEGPVIHAKGQHPWLIDRATWDAVQQRLDGEKRVQRTTQRGTTPALLTGFLRCATCGGPVSPNKFTARGPGSGHYVCSARKHAQSACDEPTVSFGVADQAVLREVARLQRRPWQPQAFDEVALRDPHADERTRLRADLAAAEAALHANAVAFRALGDLGEAAIAAFKADAQALGERIKTAKEQLAALPEAATDTASAQELHQRLGAMDLAAVVAGLAENGDVAALRDLLGALVQSARLVQRARSGKRTIWARAEVAWTPAAALLLEAGRLTLGPAPQPPVAPAAHERMLERARRYRARKKAGLVGVLPARTL
jgi:DNA invertase Pin-like site-specific DNA recombinase